MAAVIAMIQKIFIVVLLYPFFLNKLQG